MTDEQATALGRFCGLAMFCKEYPEFKFESSYYTEHLVEILNEYEKAKNERDSRSISKRTEEVLSCAEKLAESALQK